VVNEDLFSYMLLELLNVKIVSILCDIIKVISQIIHSHQELGLINRDKVHSRLSRQEILLGIRVGNSTCEGQREKVLG
jgi:hypothetical protein